MGHGKSLVSFDGPPIILYVYGWATKQKPMSTFIQGRRKPGGLSANVNHGGALWESPPPPNFYKLSFPAFITYYDKYNSK
jgi:hypothetical protein